MCVAAVDWQSGVRSRRWQHSKLVRLRPSPSNMASVVNASWFAKLHTESCVLIRDLTDCPGSLLWRTFLDASVKEKDTKNFILQLQGSTDPSAVPKWPESTTVIPFIAEVASLPVAEYCKKLLQVVSNVKISSKKSALYIDSLNSLIVLFDTRTICSILEEFTSKFTSVIAVVSSEILDIQLSTALTRLSSVIIRLQSFPSHKCTKADVTLRKEHRRLGLKIEKKEVYIRINENNKERTIEFVNISQPHIESSAGDGEKHKQMDELSKLTFNLNLTENEKHARSNVQLPYVK